MLDQHLYVNFNAAPNINQLIYVDNLRINVITPSLIRVEYDSERLFCDLPTQIIVNRDVGQWQFKYKQTDSHIIVTTQKVEFWLQRGSGNFCYAIRDNQRIILDEDSNLGGTARTLDATFGRIKLNKGILAESGVTILDDTSKSIAEGGVWNHRKSTKDSYIFAFGQKYRLAIQDYFRITGTPPLIPRYAFGNWWSRYKAYSDKEYMALMERLDKEDIPISVATIDMDWHWVDLESKFQEKNYATTLDKLLLRPTGWTGYSWNTDLFPNYKEFLAWLKARNLKITVNLHPALGVRSFEDMYKDMAIAMDIDPSTKQPIPFDIADDNFVNNYFKILHTPYELDGVDFWWIDWQQGKKSKIEGLDPLWALNHYHFLDNQKNNTRGLILSRFAGLGSHRYPLGFSGDAAINWKVLNFQPYFTATATNVGYTWWSHDIGGHHLGKRDDELYIRWLEFGVFSPINRLHSTSSEFLGKEPWNYSSEIENIAKIWLRLRHRFIPYIYTANYNTYQHGIGLIEPMYYSCPASPEAYTVPNQYYFGEALIVCPITKPTIKKIRKGVTLVWLPKGRHTDILTNQIYDGNKYHYMFRDLDKIPILAKEGAILPLSNNIGNDTTNPVSLDWWIYRGNGNYQLYEDDGITNSFKQGGFCTRELMVMESANVLKFWIYAAIGDTSVVSQTRTFHLYFKDIVMADSISLYINKVPVECDNTMDIKLTLESNDVVEIIIENPISLTNSDPILGAIGAFARYQIGNFRKASIFKSLKGEKDAKAFRQKILKLRLPKYVKRSMLEAFSEG